MSHADIICCAWNENLTGRLLNTTLLPPLRSRTIARKERPFRMRTSSNLLLTPHPAEPCLRIYTLIYYAARRPLLFRSIRCFKQVLSVEIDLMLLRVVVMVVWIRTSVNAFSVAIAKEFQLFLQNPLRLEHMFGWFLLRFWLLSCDRGFFSRRTSRSMALFLGRSFAAFAFPRKVTWVSCFSSRPIRATLLLRHRQITMVDPCLLLEPGNLNTQPPNLFDRVF
jgi:hypothetical protein